MPETPAPLRNLAAVDALAGFAAPSVIFDRRGEVLHVNDAARRVFPGLSAGIILGRWFREPDLLDAVGALLAGRPQASASFIEKRPVERAFRVDMSLIAPDRAYGLMVFLDQTEALRLDRVRADFIANASHELRTPLTAISGFLETLQGPAKNDTANRERFIALMLLQTQRMARLIDDLLSLSRLETQSAPERIEPIDLGKLVAATVDAMSPLARAQSITINNTVASGTQRIDGSPDEITQVLQNLVENACKYGGGGGRVEILPGRAGQGETAIAVRDHGPGIASEHIPRLTERFYRVDVQESRSQKGTGLGLAIVKHILQRHRGRLVIESSLGKGSTFTIVFPQAHEAD
jgi:two-component system, OmpR family, phosphate regulon sensor histidine kinase PhoR